MYCQSCHEIQLFTKTTVACLLILSWGIAFLATSTGLPWPPLLSERWRSLTGAKKSGPCMWNSSVIYQCEWHQGGRQEASGFLSIVYIQAVEKPCFSC